MIQNDRVNMDIETNIVPFEKFGFQRPPWLRGLCRSRPL